MTIRENVDHIRCGGPNKTISVAWIIKRRLCLGSRICIIVGRYCFTFAANLKYRKIKMNIDRRKLTLESFDHQFDFDGNIQHKLIDEHD
jgi:hypothetical protein